MEFIVNYKIDISKDIEELSEKFAEILINTINQNRGQISIALSGGSTPKAVLDYFAKHYKDKIVWNKINFFWGDERCVPSNHPESNYLMAHNHLFSKIDINSKNIFKIDGSNNPKIEAENYSKIIRENVILRNNIPSFDLVMLGLGEDGHTASIFPDSINLIHDKRICAVAKHPITNQERITLTGTVINNSKKIVFLVTGESKSKIVDIILNRKKGYEKFPASLVNPIYNELVWLLDTEAVNLYRPERSRGAD
jgi:6-phosphogluconolactonase